MKNKFYIMTALVISLTGCSNIEDGTQPTGNFPEDHIIRVVTEVKAPVSRAGYDASNLESFGLIIHNSENIAYDYNSQMVKSNNDWNTADGQQMLWDNARTPVTVVAYAPYISEASLDTPLAINIQSNQTTGFSVNFSYDGKLYIWTAEEPIELQKGVEHTLTLNVNETARLATMQMKYRATGQIIYQK